MISDTIKNRIESAGARYWASDNIADFIQDGEKQELIDELTIKFEGVLDSLLIDRKTDPNSMDTPRRLAKMYIKEIMSGRYDKAPKVTAFPNEVVGDYGYEGLLVIRAEIKSMCSHHHLPVSGVAYIGIVPGDKVIGLSKYIRIAQWCARRGTLQEELSTHIANEITKVTGTKNIAIHVGAEHGCCTNRGVMAHSSLTQTTVLRGGFLVDASLKQEFFDNIKLQKAGY